MVLRVVVHDQETGYTTLFCVTFGRDSSSHDVCYSGTATATAAAVGNREAHRPRIQIPEVDLKTGSQFGGEKR